MLGVTETVFRKNALQERRHVDRHEERWHGKSTKSARNTTNRKNATPSSHAVVKWPYIDVLSLQNEQCPTRGRVPTTCLAYLRTACQVPILVSGTNGCQPLMTPDRYMSQVLFNSFAE